MPTQWEKQLVEDYVVEKLKEIGWSFVDANELERLSYEEPLLLNRLKKKIKEINENFNLTEGDIKEVLRKLQNAFPDQNGHKEILRYFKYGVPIKTEKEKIVRNVYLFDFKNIENNDFIFTRQFKFSGRENIRLDVVLFVNGIPIVNIECKNPYTLKTDYQDAFRQIKRYEKDAPELYKYIQIGIGFAEIVKYFPIVPWAESVKQEIWRSERFEGFDGIFEMLLPSVLLDLLRNFIFVKEFQGEMTKIIARYMQYRATNKIYQRVIDNLKGLTDKNKGLIWHWQGSGKTLTMIFSAHKLFFDENLEAPSIFFIVDRRDLEEQFDRELKSIDLPSYFQKFERIQSIEHLKEIIAFDNFSGKRGVFLTLIHKFNIEEAKILDELISKETAITKRKNIICFLDEVHRTQYGTLASKLKNILKSAFFFGFTGTPIFEKERNTYREFGYPVDEELYLDKYFIDEALKDGFIVPLVYESRLEEEHIPEEDLDWFLQQIEIEDISDEYERSLIASEVRKRLNKTVLFLENEKRIDKISQDIASHFKENFEGRFKGLIVTGSRLSCVRYKKAIDKYLDPKYTEVVMTFTAKDREYLEKYGIDEIEDYRKKLTERFKSKDVSQIIKEIIEKFQTEEKPQLLIVTDMLITGFDEPKIGVIYLHKLLKNHKLLQTIARANRPYRDLKSVGVIVDYVGILENIEKAFAVYGEDAKKIGPVDKKAILDKFLKILNELKELFGKLFGKFEREIFDEALDLVTRDEEKEKEFVAKYREIRKFFEYLDYEERIKHLTDYKWLTCLYEYYLKIKKPEVPEPEIERYFKRTVELVHQMSEIKEVKKLSPPILIDLNYLEAILNSNLTEKEKAIGIITTLDKLVLVYGGKNPIYRSVADKVKKLIKEWKERKDYYLLYQEGIKIYQYLKEKEKEKKESGLDEKRYGMKVILENKIKTSDENILKIAEKIHQKIENLLFKGWSKNPSISLEVERKIREILAEERMKYRLSYEDFDTLSKEIFEFLFNND